MPKHGKKRLELMKEAAKHLMTGMTQKQIAEKMDLPKVYVNRLIFDERRRREIEGETPLRKTQAGEHAVCSYMVDPYWDAVEYQPLAHYSEEQPVKLMDLKFDSCRAWVSDDPVEFCGERTMVGSSYCERHHEVCYRKGEG